MEDLSFSVGVVRRRRLPGIPLAVLVFLVSVVGSVGDQAAAYPEDANLVMCTRAVLYTFDTDHPVPSARRPRVSEGFEQWNTFLDPDNNPLVDVDEDNDNGVIEVLGKEITPLATSDCNGSDNWVIFNMDEVDPETGRVVRGVAMHEMGHILKMNHTGNDDSYKGWINTDEVMSTCVNAYAEYESFRGSMDDAGSLAKQHQIGEGAPGPDWLFANAGFEQDTGGPNVAVDGWVINRTPLMAAPIDSPSAPRGDHYLALLPDDNLDGVHQRLNLTGFNGDTLDVRADYGAAAAADSGKIIFQLFVRGVDYSSVFDACNPGQFPQTGLNENERVVPVPTPPWVLAVDWRVSPSTWTTGKNSLGDDAKYWVLETTHDAWDARLLVRSSVVDSSDDHVLIYVDNVTARQR